MAEWTDLSSWWLNELAADRTYSMIVTPLMVEILEPNPGKTYLDLGCGQGQTMRELAGTGAGVVGCDRDATLLRTAQAAGSVVRCELSDLSWLRNESLDGTYASLVFEHLADLPTMFAESYRVVRAGGVLAAVLNHPLFAAPASGPIVDQDGELFWRWGRYLSGGSITEPVEGGSVTVHHRPIAELLSMAADAGWVLEHILERAIDQHMPVPQEEIPRLLAVCWRKP